MTAPSRYRGQPVSEGIGLGQIYLGDAPDQANGHCPHTTEDEVRAAFAAVARDRAALADRLRERGATVFWAANGEEARDYIVNLAKQKNARTIIKSKSMTSEEIHLNQALQSAGFDVISYDNGLSAYQRLREEPFELLLTDIVMPEMDGI